MQVLTEKAVAWIERQQAGEPFFLYFTPVAPHEPVSPSATTAGTSKAGSYGDWIRELDLSVGRVLAALEKKGFAKNTLNPCVPTSSCTAPTASSPFARARGS